MLVKAAAKHYMFCSSYNCDGHASPYSWNIYPVKMSDRYAIKPMIS